MRKLLVPALGALLASMVLAAVLPAATGSATGFNPDRYAGHWSGTWHNETFDSSGPAEMDLESKGRKFIGVFELGGNAFGCQNPPPRTVKMKKGKGANSWNKKGFRAQWDNDHGTLHIAYKHADKEFSGDGVSPCTPDITYTYDGKMTRRKVTADVDIRFEGDPLATSTLEMTKQPD